MSEADFEQDETYELISEITPGRAISDAIRNGLIVESYQIIGSGKEAFVIWAKDEDFREVAMKSYRIFRTTHRDIINNTPRTSPFSVIAAFARREYWKAYAVHKLSIPSPQPYECKDYSFTMEFLGDNNGPFPLLSSLGKSSIDDPGDVLEQCIDILHGLFQGRFVHGDFSEHNLIFDGETVFVIDFLQSQRFALKDAVHYESPLIKLSEAFSILQKDITAILTYFQRAFRMQIDYAEVEEYIVGDMKKKIKRVLELKNESTFSEYNRR